MTATLIGMTLPSRASHVEDKLAPMPLLRVQAFVDTLDQDQGTDTLAHPDEARAWLADTGLRVPDAQIPDRPDAGFAAPLEEVLGQAEPRLDVSAGGQVHLGPSWPAHTLTDGLLGLLVISRDTQADGSLDRLKLCGNPDCRRAFYDRSHSRRSAWCDMATCGNRLKNRNLRARRAQVS